jgi:hypothetical protein
MLGETTGAPVEAAPATLSTLRKRSEVDSADQRVPTGDLAAGRHRLPKQRRDRIQGWGRQLTPVKNGTEERRLYQSVDCRSTPVSRRSASAPRAPRDTEHRISGTGPASADARSRPRASFAPRPCGEPLVWSVCAYTSRIAVLRLPTVRSRPFTGGTAFVRQVACAAGSAPAPLSKPRQRAQLPHGAGPARRGCGRRRRARAATTKPPCTCTGGWRARRDRLTRNNALRGTGAVRAGSSGLAAAITTDVEL